MPRLAGPLACSCARFAVSQLNVLLNYQFTLQIDELIRWNARKHRLSFIGCVIIR